MSPVKMNKVEEALRLALTFAQSFNRHDAEAIGEMFSENGVFESASPAPVGSRHEGRSAALAAIGGFFASNPELEMQVEEAYGMGNRAVLRWRLTGIASIPEGRRGVDLFTVKDGRIVELLAYAKA